MMSSFTILQAQLPGACEDGLGHYKEGPKGSFTQWQGEFFGYWYKTMIAAKIERNIR